MKDISIIIASVILSASILYSANMIAENSFEDVTPGLNGEGHALVIDFSTCNASTQSVLIPIAFAIDLF